MYFDQHRDGANEDSRPNSVGNETSSTLLPPESRGGSGSSQDPQIESAGSRKKPHSGNKVRFKPRSNGTFKLCERETGNAT